MKWEYGKIVNDLEQLLAIVPESLAELDEKNYIQPLDHSESCDQSETWKNRLLDLRDSNNELFSIAPFLSELQMPLIATTKTQFPHRAQESPQTAEAKVEEMANSPAQAVQLEGPAHSYWINIRDKFPKIQHELAHRLAQLNATRFQVIANHAPIHEHAELPCEVPIAVLPDSALGTSLMTPEFLRKVESSLRREDDKHAMSVVSATSFGTHNASMSGHTTIPPPPAQLGSGMPFRCNICFKEVRNVKDDLSWK